MGHLKVQHKQGRKHGYNSNSEHKFAVVFLGGPSPIPLVALLARFRGKKGCLLVRHVDRLVHLPYVCVDSREQTVFEIRKQSEGCVYVCMCVCVCTGLPMADHLTIQSCKAESQSNGDCSRCFNLF